MKRFYLALFLFVLPIFVFLGGAEYYVRSLPNIYKYKNEWMEEHAEEVEMLVLGNSHTGTAINPKYVSERMFNLANIGQEYMYDHFLFFKWAERCKKLKMVIISVSYFSFYKNVLGNESEKMQELNYSLYMDCPYHRYDVSYSLESLYFSPLCGKIRKHLSGKDVNWSADGWIKWPLAEKSSVWNAEHVNKSLARIYLAHSYDYVETNYRYLEGIVRYCYQHDVRIVLVSTPQTKEYNKCLDSRQIAHTHSLVDKLQKQYAVEYYDYREDYRFTDDDFYDQSHLSEVGAEKFTKLLM